jgi:hypothetical protein
MYVQGFVGTDSLSLAICACGLVMGLCVALSVLSQLLIMSKNTPGTAVFAIWYPCGCCNSSVNQLTMRIHTYNHLSLTCACC